MSADIYLDELLSPQGGPGPSTTAYRAWEEAIAAFETQQTEGPPLDAVPGPVGERVPWPTLHSLLGVDANVDSVANGLAAVNIREPPSSAFVSAPSSTPMTRTPSMDVTSIQNRVHNHLQPSALISMLELLNSPRSDEDIQLELVEILGFEGDGLALVEDLLKPGVRQALLAAERGGKRKGKGAQAGKKGRGIDITEMIGSADDIERRLQEQLNRPKAMFAPEGQQRIHHEEKLPNVFTSGASVSAALSMGGRFALPAGTTREQTPICEEVIVPPPLSVPPKATERPVMINALPPLARRCFPGYASLNRMQSVVHPTAMGTNENMLVCAPTGAGKTDVAIMTILRVLQTHLLPAGRGERHPSGFSIAKDQFKIIYVAPMKALAAEITRKFGKRLAWLGIKVAELTGDMQMTKKEIEETQIIITTPEKWDVVTRKPTGEGELASIVRLLIIDEVHLLNEDRGAVIETIVARTLRQVEASQTPIRIVGLSATLPNYIDVSDFLRVNRYQGLFFFDASFRPVPLEQHFIGVKGKPRSTTSMRNMDQVVFDKVLEMVREGHQVMVFVHARKETVKTAQRLKEMAQEEGALDLFDAHDHPKYQLYRRDMTTSRNKEMKELFDYGFGIHHAGMLRSDRSMTERLFEDNAIKVLCCTSTLAWGVNLPAHAVVIKGTQVYDSNKGAFMDLSVLDVLQIFGRAGRPGYETSGEGYICTTEDKLDHYLTAIMSQHPIESKFIPGMVDALNAEVSLGTIANVRDAISWIGYTYLFVRMRKEPFIYGMSHNESRDDPQLGNKRSSLVTQAARQLMNAKMIRFDELNNTFAISDLGRIAARYYIRHQTVEVFNEKFNARMKNADLFAMLAEATEFQQVQIRDNEIDELTNIMNSDRCPMEVKGGATSAQGKVNILLQGYISRAPVDDFALVSDQAYVAQNAGRIIRALLEIALSRKWANCALLLVDLSKAIERRMWPYEHPLGQMSLNRDTLYNLHRWADDTEVSELRAMDAKSIGELVHMNEQHGDAINKAARMFPTVGVTYALRPLSHDLLQINVTVEPQFEWPNRTDVNLEPFYVWIQDEEGVNILEWRSLAVRRASATMTLDFVLPWVADAHHSLSIVTVSDRWLGSDSQTAVSLANLVMPAAFDDKTPMLDLPFLRIGALDDGELEQAYRPHVPMFNNIQSQVFWSMYHTQNNVLLSAPVGCGKSVMGEMAIWHAFRHNPKAFVLVVVPRRTAAIEVAARIRSVMPKSRKVAVKHATYANEFARVSSGDEGMVVVATPQALSEVNGQELAQLGHRLSLLLLEDVHLLDARYELAIVKLLSVTRPIRTRIVALTCTLSDPSDLGSWLGVAPEFRFLFYPQDRSAPVIVQLRTFSIPHSFTLLKAMIKPTYDLLKTSSGSAIIFTPSIRACSSAAADLVTKSGTEMDLRGFLGPMAERQDVEPLLARLRDTALLEPLLRGIGYVVPNMAPADMAIVLELYASGIVRVLITPHSQAWTLPVRASTVILMGAQYFQRGSFDSQHSRQILGYSRHELVKMQGFAVRSAAPAADSGRMFVMCQGEQQTGIAAILANGLPLESELPAVLKHVEDTPTATLEHMLTPRDPPPPLSVHRPRVPDLRKRDLMDLLSWSLFGRRIKSNPTFYDMIDALQGDTLSRLVDEWFQYKANAAREHEKKKAVVERSKKAEAETKVAVAVAKEEEALVEAEDGASAPQAPDGPFKIEEFEVLEDSDSD